MQNQKNWTEPTLVPKNPKPEDMASNWRVRFRFFNAQSGKWSGYLSFKKGINYYHNFRERLAEANALRDELKHALEQGWNPLTNTYDTPPIKDSIDDQLEKLKHITFSDALDFAVEKKKAEWSKKTCQDYSSVIKYLKIAGKSLSIHDKKISDFKLAHYRLILEEVKSIRKLSSKGYNKYREYLSSLVGELITWEIVELNLVHHVKTKQVIKTIAHRPPTADQKDLIIGKIKLANRPYYRFLCILYGCTLRPKEITGLKIKDFHRKEQVFRIIPVHEEGNSKVKFERETTIPDWVMAILSEMNLHNYNPEWYIFSSHNKYNSFMPGPNRMHPNTPTLTWRKLVKDKIEDGGLGLDVNQYSLKKLAGNDMVKIQRIEGIDRLLDLPRQQMGHTTTRQTEDYVTEHIDVMKELVKRKMPEL